MVVIGISAAKNSLQIAKALLLIIKSNKKVAAVKHCSALSAKEVKIFSMHGIDYFLIIFDSEKIYPVNLDILILDNPDNLFFLDINLFKCIGNQTVLIYNTDNDFLPHIEHPNAIDYGLCTNSSISISSVSYLPNSHISLCVCIQKKFSNPIYRCIDIGEIHVDSKFKFDISNQLAAIICAFICGLTNYTDIEI